ncbi:MAG TPA: molybdenum hydroxylase, partial [Clostridia bacterium]|nr:molybdenum hydroxylase [Clostridia bacterium]
MLIAIKGAGDLASGIALRLYRARFNVAMSELALPTTIRTAVSFSRAVTEGEANVEGVNAKLAKDVKEAAAFIKQGLIAVLVDPDAACLLKLKPDVLVDAILAKANLGTRLSDAPVVIGVGPGFSAGVDCHAVVETRRGHTLGRVITEG